MKPLRVLVVNRVLDTPSGTVTYTRDLALGLQRTGHAPMVWSPRLGVPVDAIRAAAIPVTDRLEAVGSPPDVIHGHHLLTTLAALQRFPGVPAVFVCHDAASFFDTGPRHPRIRRYIAVDSGCRERLVNQEGVPAERCLLVPNAVDLERFRPRGPLPARPTRALAFGNVLAGAELATLEEVCRSRGIRLDAAGEQVGGAVAQPERRLGDYDVVFAKGRCALEALAVGAAVVVCGPGGLGPLVSSDRVDALRTENFGRRAYRLPFDAANVAAQLDRYDAADAAAVGERVRSFAGLDGLTADLVEVYEAVCAEERAAPAPRAAEDAALAQTLEWLSAAFDDAVSVELWRARREERSRRRRWGHWGR